MGVNFTYLGGKFNDAEVTIPLFFCTALGSEQKKGLNFMLGSWQRVNGRKKVENPWSRVC